MKTAASFCLALLCAMTSPAQAQLDIFDGLYSITAVSLSGGVDQGTMVFDAEGDFTYTSTANGLMTGFFLETEDPLTGGTLRYAIYFDDQDQLHFLYAQTTDVNIGLLSLSLIYGVGFGQDDTYGFYGYGLLLDFPDLPF